MKFRLDERELRTLLAEISKRDTKDLALDDDLMTSLEIDSLAALRMLATVEKRYGVRFPDDQLSKLRTMRQVIDGIEAMPPEEEPL